MAAHTFSRKLIISAKRQSAEFLVHLLYIFIGTFIITPGVFIYFTITLPFIVYHACIAFILSKWYRSCHGYRGMVNPGFSTAYALEYLHSLSKGQPSRNTILVREVIEGHVPLETCRENIENGWVKAKDKNDLWRIPELRSYVDSWMGYCYWREESNFDFNSHIHYHKTEETENIDHFLSHLFDSLLNTPFIPKRSPWDVHIIHGWKPENHNTLHVSSNARQTVIIIRTHHVLGDGNSLSYLIFRDLFGVCMKGFEKETHKKVTKAAISIPRKLTTVILAITKLMWDFGCIAVFILWKAKTNTKLHALEKQEIRYVHYMSSSCVSMDTVKQIAKKFGVSVSGVVFSSMASAISKSLGKEHPENFLLAAPRPLAGHPTDRMVNHMTGAAYNVPINVDMHPIQRMIKCDKLFKTVNKSLFPTHVFPVLVHFLSYHIAPIAKFGFKSRQFGASLSNNMSTPVAVCVFDGIYRLLEHSGTIATYDGCTGIAVVIVSYANEFRLHGVANSDSLNKQELEAFIEQMVAEINYFKEEKYLSSESSVKNLVTKL